MTKTTTYRVSRINAETSYLYEYERCFRVADENTVNEVRRQMRADIETGSSDWIRVREI